MRKHLPLFLQLALLLLFGSAVVFMAQTEHITPFTETWKPNRPTAAVQISPSLQPPGISALLLRQWL